MNDLVEQKLKKLHYFPPNFRVQAPHSIVAAHPLLAGIPKTAFRSEVCTHSMLTSHAKFQKICPRASLIVDVPT